MKVRERLEGRSGGIVMNVYIGDGDGDVSGVDAGDGCEVKKVVHGTAEE